MTALHISCQFDSGAIEVVSLSDYRNIQLHIRKDLAADFAQWFHFALHGAAGLPVTLRRLQRTGAAAALETAMADGTIIEASITDPPAGIAPGAALVLVPSAVRAYPA